MSLGLWRTILRVGKPPFLKGFSLWTSQSERVCFYWPPGPNPVVTISTRVGPCSRLSDGETFALISCIMVKVLDSCSTVWRALQTWAPSDGPTVSVITVYKSGRRQHGVQREQHTGLIFSMVTACQLAHLAAQMSTFGRDIDANAVESTGSPVQLGARWGPSLRLSPSR